LNIKTLPYRGNTNISYQWHSMSHNITDDIRIIA
jgi:hypothetical protein